MTNAEATFPADRELVLTRLIAAPRRTLYRAFTEPELLMQWFAPLPWRVTKAELDVRPGGTNFFVMADPEGNEYPNHGVYLEVVPDERIVITDAFTSAWEPSEKPFMTAIVTFADAAGGTRYTAVARHWSVEDCAAHEKMGFHEGWGQAADQLAALAARI